MASLCRFFGALLLVTATLALGMGQFSFAGAGAALAFVWLVAGQLAALTARQESRDP
jgi:hypothetical protein